jgi:CheY-like chemotaxis protein
MGEVPTPTGELEKSRPALLPRSSPPDAEGFDFGEAPTAATRSLVQADRPVLLVADDSEADRCLTQAICESLGYEVRLACNGVEAVEACVDAAPAALVTDLSMPQMSGFEAAARLTKLQRAGAVEPFPIIGMSSERGPQVSRRCLDCGMSGFVPKPLGRAALGAELERVFGAFGVSGAAGDSDPRAAISARRSGG